MRTTLDNTRLEVIWHDVECGAYADDHEIWAALAEAARAPGVLEIGCGTGRVGLDLARRGHSVLGIDREAAFVATASSRAAEHGLDRFRAMTADARELTIEDRFGLAVLPMQLLQLFGERHDRARLLLAARRHLVSGGHLAAAIIEGAPLAGRVGSEYESALPDVAEIDGWVYSSLPLEVSVAGDEMVITRLRQVVAPGGDLSECVDRTRLAVLTSAELISDAAEIGLDCVASHAIADSPDHVGSTVLVMEAR